jgi:hypothetical protein
VSRRAIVRLAAGLWSLAPGILAAQGVMVAPHAVFIDHRTRSGSILLYNPSTDPAEVTISTLFGYPVTDSLGRIVLRTVDQPDSTMPNAAAWLQAFPRRLTVAPLERQTIRLLMRPPSTLPDGEYWARLVITARGGQLPVTGVSDTGRIQVGLTLEVRTIIGVNYRKGTVQTGLAVSGLRATLVADTVEVRSRLERQGNAAFIGTIRATLVDSAGTNRGAFFTPIGVYYTMEPRFTIPVGVLPRGRYWLRFEAKTEREDLDPRALLPAPLVVDSVEVRVP